MSASSIDLDALLRRLHLPTVRRLYRELEERAEKESMPHRDYLATLIAEEVAHRAQTRISRSTRKAQFPFLATVETFDFTFQSSIRLAALGSLLGPELVSEGRCAIFFGNSGTGKTHLAIAIAYRAIQNGFEARFVDADALLEQLSRASQRDQLEFALEEYLHPHVLVIDEVGYLNHRADAANVLFQVVNARHLNKRPTIFTTNKPLGTWGRVLHDADLAEAIIDRVLERGRLITLNGQSFRTRHMAHELRGARSSRTSQLVEMTGADDSDLPPAVVEHGARISGKRGPELTEPTCGGQTLRRLRRDPSTDRGELRRALLLPASMHVANSRRGSRPNRCGDGPGAGAPRSRSCRDERWMSSLPFMSVESCRAASRPDVLRPLAA